MPNSFVHVNEAQLRVEDAVLDFFETYRRKAATAPAAFPLERTAADWLDDFAAFLDETGIGSAMKRPSLRDTIREAAIAALDISSADAAADRTGQVIDFPAPKSRTCDF